MVEPVKTPEPITEKIEEEPLVLSKEIGTTAKTNNKELNQTLSPAVRKIVEEKRSLLREKLILLV